jgi:hypothetical protein
VLFVIIVGHGYSAPQGFEGAVYLDHLSEMVKEWDVLKAGFAREISHGGEAEFSCRRIGGCLNEGRC